jgi:uncharacterized membrane protein
MAHQQAQDDAPKRTQRDDKDGTLAIVGRSVTVNRPRSELFAFWRDFRNLPSFMHAIESIEMVDDKRSTWKVKAPAGQHVTLETELAASSRTSPSAGARSRARRYAPRVWSPSRMPRRIAAPS